MFLSSVWGIIFGILAPLFIINSNMEIASHHALRVWLVMAAVGHLVPCFLVMFDKSKIAAAFSVIGTVLMLYIHSVFSEHTYSFTYMPQIFMTILTILYIFVINPHYITGVSEKRHAKLNAPAPSVLERRGDEPSPVKKSRGDYQSPAKKRRGDY